jgi:hypothetical protein
MLEVAMSDECSIDKWILTDDDFEQMAWHDCRICGMAFSSEDMELLLDIDYIVSWLEPAPGDNSYRLWFAPATVVFRGVLNLEIGVDALEPRLDIDGVRRAPAIMHGSTVGVDVKPDWDWTIDCQEGDIAFRSEGFQLFFRSDPRPLKDRRAERALTGYSFERGRTRSDVAP